MASSRRDLQRFRKVYPYFRRPPRYVYVSATPPESADMILETGEITFTGTDSESYSFTKPFTASPAVTAVALDSASNQGAGVAVHLVSVSLSGFVVRTSAPLVGKVVFQAIQSLS